MTTYTSTEAERLSYLFERGELDLSTIVKEAVSDIIENALRTLTFIDGSEWVLPYPWAA